MAGFVLRLIPPRPTFIADMTADERAVMDAHGAYWREQATAGRALAFGPVDDPAGPYGICVLVADDLNAAEALRDGDPVLSSPIGFRVEIAPMLRLVTPDGVR